MIWDLGMILILSVVLLLDEIMSTCEGPLARSTVSAGAQAGLTSIDREQEDH
jgi:hypothetical protein